MVIDSAPERPVRHRRPLSTASGSAVATLVAVIGVLGVSAWYIGLFASDGRFPKGLDACTLMPPPAALGPLVPDGSREPGDSRPRTPVRNGSVNTGGSDVGVTTSSWCGWNSARRFHYDQFVSAPFRTFSIDTESTAASGRTSAETVASRALATLKDAKTNGERPTRIGVGEEGYSGIETTLNGGVVFEQDPPSSFTYDYRMHVEFRVSNTLIDVSVITHRSRPTAQDMALVTRLAKSIADGLERRA